MRFQLGGAGGTATGHNDPALCDACAADMRLDALIVGLGDAGVTVVTLISNQVLRPEALDQPRNFRTICAGTFCNKDSEGHAMCLHGQMYSGVELSWVRSMP